jgi:LysM repeat protein
MYETYTVKQGDTLYGISNQFGVSVTELAELNNIQGSNLPVGTVLKIPSKSGVNPNNMFMYTVQKGDTLYSIARKYNTTVQAILDINYLKSNDLSVGQVIRIPENYYNYDEMSVPNYITYTVKPGDTLYSIASANGVSVDTIISDNVLPNNSLSVGQVLRLRVIDGEVLECFGPDFEIPEEIVPSITYVVKSGDNLYNIARKFNTSVSAISNLNNLSNSNLSVGQQLLIPTAEGSDNTNEPDRTYIVQKGDSLYSIARKFGATVTDITRLNNLTGTSLSIGQQLLIPSSSSNNLSSGTGRTYVVQRGDSLYSIARKFNTSVDEIRRRNNLVSNLLSVGQTLII